MSLAGLGTGGRWALTGVAAAVIAAVELGLGAGGGGAIVVTLALWTAAAQGSVAVVAAGELTNVRWISAVKPQLLSAARLLPALALLFLVVGAQVRLYPWSAHPGAWLNGPFFVGRNVALLLVVAAVAALFGRSAARGDRSARPLAVVYLALFAASQTLVAFDWVMSLSWPWVSSMLGMFFSVEAFYVGVAQAALLFALSRPRDAARGASGAAGRDVGLLLFGFSVLWGGLFFAQFLLLWYGNLPEEVGFIATRMSAEPTRALGIAFIAACFGVPFLALMPERAKWSPPFVALVALALLCGQAAERLFLTLPVLPLRWGLLAAENLILIAVWWVVVAAAPPVPAATTRGGGA